MTSAYYTSSEGRFRGRQSKCGDWNILALRDAVTSGSITTIKIVQAYLDRINKHDVDYNSFVQVYEKRSLQQAAELDIRIANGGVVGPLAGSVIAIKDNICTNWGYTTCASTMLANYKSPYNATTVQKLLDADAIIIGKTNMDEFAMGSSCENSIYGATRNPCDITRVAGGSSGGSAAAVAAGLCTAALGSDTGGSVRQPASFTGTVGMRPSYGVISRHGLIAYASSLDQIGPVTRNVNDAALLLDVISGYDDQDSTSHPRADMFDFTDYFNNSQQKHIRIGLPRQFISNTNDKSVNDMLKMCVNVLEKKLGAEIIYIDLPMTTYGVAIYYIIATAECSSNLARYDGIRYGYRAQMNDADDLTDLYTKSRTAGFSEEVKRRIMLGTFALSTGYYDEFYLRALKARRLIKEDFNRAFDKCDFIIGPTTTTPAFKLNEKTNDPLQMYMSDIYTVSSSLAGLPTISIPAGCAKKENNHLPLGMQIIAPDFYDVQLLQIADMFMQANKSVD